MPSKPGTKFNGAGCVVIPAMMAAGYLFGISAGPASLGVLKGLILPLTFLMVYPMMVTLNIKALQYGIKNVGLQLSAQAINFLVVPFIAYGLGLIFFRDQPYMALGLLLLSLNFICRDLIILKTGNLKKISAGDIALLR